MIQSAYPLPDLPLWTSLAIVATYAVCTLCAIAIALWRAFYSPKARGGGSRRWPLRGLLYGLLITSFVSRVAEFSLSQLLADAAVRTPSSSSMPSAPSSTGRASRRSRFIEEVRRSAQHEPGRHPVAVNWLRRDGAAGRRRNRRHPRHRQRRAASHFAVAACECVTCGLYFVVAGLASPSCALSPGRGASCSLGVLGVYLASRTAGLVLAALAVAAPTTSSTARLLLLPATRPRRCRRCCCRRQRHWRAGAVDVVQRRGRGAARPRRPRGGAGADARRGLARGRTRAGGAAARSPSSR